MEITRRQGRVVLVGYVRLDIHPKNFLHREIDLRYSRAYGPGSYHTGYEKGRLDYPFGYPMARWLAVRFPRATEIAWSRFDDADRLDETLSLLATAAEGDAFSEGGMGWRQWLRVAKGGRRLSDLAVVLELFTRTGLPQETRDWLFESVALPILWRPRGPGASRTLARLPCR